MAKKPVVLVPSKKFGDMNGIEKITFVGKAFVFFLSSGFIFPSMFSD